jgi:hypothetical protein
MNFISTSDLTFCLRLPMWARSRKPMQCKMLSLTPLNQNSKRTFCPWVWLSDVGWHRWARIRGVCDTSRPVLTPQSCLKKFWNFPVSFTGIDQATAKICSWHWINYIFIFKIRLGKFKGICKNVWGLYKGKIGMYVMMKTWIQKPFKTVPSTLERELKYSVFMI